MKLSALLERFPWHETREALFKEPPERDELPLKSALVLIEAQRDSQLRVLLEMLHSPVLEDGFATDAVEIGATRPEPRHKLRDATEASQLFLTLAAQTGKTLGPFGFERLNELDRRDAALGRLLLLLSITETLSWERPEYADRWAEIVHEGVEDVRDAIAPGATFGVVLTPMVFAARQEGGPAQGGAISLLAESLRVATKDERVIGWVPKMIEEGSRHLDTLSGHRLLGEPERGEGRPLEGRHTRDVRLVKAEGGYDDFLDALKSLPGVEQQTRFITEEDPRFMCIRVWGDELVDDETLNRLARQTGARIASATEDRPI